MSESILPNYSFLPWLRKGIGNKLNEEEDKGAGTGNLERGKVDVELEVFGEGNLGGSATKEINLVGPGDIKGISPGAIVKSIPEADEFNFEPNYLAGIEFYDEDFLWRYSPAAANTDGQLRPWMCLFVLKEDEFTLIPPTSDSLPVIKILAGAEATFLPKPDELDTWAHVQINDDLTADGSDLDDQMSRLMSQLNSNPDLGICRLLSPRRLEPNTDYYAFLVPTYETGRLAGLNFGQDVIGAVAAQLSSWGAPHAADTEENHWPVYHNWTFRTGEAGDFEYLVRQLKPKTINDEVGRRDMDMQSAGYGLKYKVTLPGETEGETVEKTTLKLEGALKVPGTSSEAYPYADASDAVDYDAATETDFRKQLQDILNLEEDFKDPDGLAASGNYYGESGNTIAGTQVDDDPIVLPPQYGRWHSLNNTTNMNDTSADGGTKPNWFNELNLDPRNRVIAALGTSIVQQKQDVLMDQAWNQLGDVIEANKRLVLAQFAAEASNAMFKKHVESQPDDKLLSMTGKVKRRMVNDTTDKTYFQELKESKLPVASQDKALRRIMRPVGPVMKRVDPNQEINSGSDNMVSRLDSSTVTAADEKVAPLDTYVSISSRADQLSGISNAAGISVGGITFRIGGIGESPGGDNTTEKTNFKSALNNFNGYFSSANWSAPAAKPVFDITKAAEIKTKVLPKATMHARVYKSVVLDSIPERIVPVMAHPSFRQPMYEAVRDLDTNWLIPNLSKVPMNTIALLETNQKFIESFMVGLNHEMSRELLWREYPTDQRGTYFQQFWNVSDHVNTTGDAPDVLESNLYDIPKIHTWGNITELGDHNNRSEESNLVLLIRGDLLKRYPNAIIYAVEAEWDLTDGLPNYTLPRKPKTDGEIYPIFNAKIEPDITFIGFEITEEQAKGADPAATQTALEDFISGGGAAADFPVADAGYFFVLKERVGETRFGIDVAPEVPPATYPTWADLTWGEITSTERIELGALSASPLSNDIEGNPINWSTTMNAAEMAMILYQNPVKVSVHAREMLSVPTE